MGNTHPRRTACLLALFFVALTLLGLLTTGAYGQPWDEPWEQDILRMNLNQYAQAFGVDARLPLLSSIDKPDSGLIEDSIERDHGECAYYPVFFLVSATGMPAATRMLLWHGWTWLLFMGGVASLWMICRRLGLSRLLSCVAALLLVLSPRFFAEGHYNNKDIVLFALTLFTVWQGMRLAEKPTLGRSALFALAGAMSANTKVIGVALWGLTALLALGHLLATRRMNRRAWWSAAFCVVCFAAFYALLTPALWRDPFGYLRYTVENAVGFTRWKNHILFRGQYYWLERGDRLPRWYLPYMMLITTPTWITLLFAVGLGCAAHRVAKQGRACLKDGKTVCLLACALLWLLPLAFAVATGATVYNGWRHFYFLYAPALVLAGYGLLRIAQVVRSHRVANRLCAATLAVCMLVTGVSMTLAHPYQYVYYSPVLIGGNLPTYLELDYWNVSALNALKELCASHAGELRVAGAEQWSQEGLRNAEPLLSTDERARLTVLPEGDATADYVLSNSTYAALSGWQPEQGMTAAVSCQPYGVPLMTVYARREGVQ